MADGKRLLLIGGGGHCASVLDSVLRAGEYEKVGIVDGNASVSIMGVSVAGSDGDLPELLKNGWTHAFISVGSIGDVKLRRKLYSMVKELGFAVPSIIDPSAVIAGNADIAEGVFIGKNSVVNTGAVIGTCAIINTSSVVEHDCSVGEFCHVSPGAVLLGNVKVGNNTHIGAGSVVRQGTKIDEDVLVGQGSNVVSDIESGVTAFGNPCRVVIR